MSAEKRKRNKQNQNGESSFEKYHLVVKSEMLTENAKRKAPEIANVQFRPKNAPLKKVSLHPNTRRNDKELLADLKVSKEKQFRICHQKLYQASSQVSFRF